MTTSPELRMAERGIILPPAPKPVASYVSAVVFGNIAYTAGQLPRVDGKLTCTGKLGLTVDLEQGRAAARAACVNAVAALRAAAGNLDHVERIINLTVYVQCADNFTEQSQVANAASDVLQEIFGDAGQHARTAIGVNSLPMNASVEVSLVAGMKAPAAKP